MVDDARAFQIAASLAEEEAMDLLTFLVSENTSGRGLSREDFLTVSGGIRDRLLVVFDYNRGRQVSAASADVEHKLYTAEEAAAFLTLHQRKRVVTATVVRWAREGRLEAGWGRSSGGRRPQWLISPRSLKRCLEVGVPDPGTYKNPQSIMDQPKDFLDTLLPPDPEA